jgi:tetratricopeptide (TPR) repeat protein
MSSDSVKPEVLADEQVRQLTALVTSLKDAGNSAIKVGNHTEAIQLYSKGIEAASAISQHISQQLFSQLYSNRAAVYSTLKQFVASVDDCRKAVEIDPLNVKGYYRGAKASMSLDLFRQACDFCERGLEANPDCADLSDLLVVCNSTLRSYHEARAVEARGFSQDDAANCQNELRHITEQYHMLHQKLSSKEFEIARMKSTVRALSELESVPCYKTLGRGFVLNDKDCLISELNNQISQSCNDAVNLKETLTSLGSRKDSSEREMREIIEFFRKQEK